MSPASYLTAPPRVAERSIARRAADDLARGQPGGGRRQPVRRAGRGQRAVGADPPGKDATSIRVQRIEELSVRAERLVPDARTAVDRCRRDSVTQLDAAV